MDLSLQTGWPLSFIQGLSERELGEWDKYRLQRGFPLRRIELGLALITKWIAGTMGGVQHADLRDFLFDPPEEEREPTPEEIEALKAEIGFRPING